MKEGVLTKSKSGRKLRAFLCSDILVLTEDATKSLYRMVRLRIGDTAPNLILLLVLQPLSLPEVEVRETSGLIRGLSRDVFICTKTIVDNVLQMISHSRWPWHILAAETQSPSARLRPATVKFGCRPSRVLAGDATKHNVGPPDAPKVDPTWTPFLATTDVTLWTIIDSCILHIV